MNNTTRGMVIIETRTLPNMHAVLSNHVKYTGWPLLIIHGDSNEEHVRKAAKFLPVEVEFHNIHENKLSSHDYNRLLGSIEFWEAMPWDKVLVFQTDSWLLRTGIEQYMQYDFIGAPLHHFMFPAMNGGLSLRDRAAMINIINRVNYEPNFGNEDIYFCRILEMMSGKMPSKEIARSFSVETIKGFGSFGVHALDKYQSEEDCKLILNQYK